MVNDNGSLESVINSSYTQLSPAEQKIAKYVLDHPDEVLYASVTQVAENLGLAQSTVTRFCHSIGLRGFQELKIKLALTVEKMKNTEETTKVSLPERLAKSTIDNITNTLDMFDFDTFENVIEQIISARKICIFGVGESGAIAQLLKIKLIGLGKTVEADQDTHVQLMSCAHLTSDDVAIAISQTGSTKDIVSVLGKAKESGAKTICITGHGRSPITEVADSHLISVSTGISVLEKDLKSKTELIFMIELIVLSVHLFIKEHGSEIATWKTTESILHKLY